MLAVVVLILEVAGASGIGFTARGLTSWDDTLQRSVIVPTPWVAGPVGTLLFAPLGAAPLLG